MAKIKMTLMIYRGLGVNQDLQTAFKLFDEISWTRENFGSFSPCRFNSVARYYAAKMSENGEGAQQNFSKALHFYEETFNNGDGSTPYHREAVKKVMWMYELGEGIPQDKVKAETWRKKLSNSDEE